MVIFSFFYFLKNIILLTIEIWENFFPEIFQI